MPIVIILTQEIQRLSSLLVLSCLHLCLESTHDCLHPPLLATGLLKCFHSENEIANISSHTSVMAKLTSPTTCGKVRDAVT